MPRLRSPAFALAFPLLALLGCPQATQPAPTQQTQAPPPTDDKRVVADSEDYYPADRGTPNSPPTPAAPGSGLPDDTNGKCRLFAPELPNPECCARELGFDVATVKRACKLKLYLGESFHATCGYYFLPDVTAQGTEARWFRLSSAKGATAKEAAATHDEYTRKVSRDPDFTSAPVPGIPDAYWSSQDDLHWAFLPGWPVVRQLTWQSDACTDDGIREVIQQLIDTPEIPAGSPRTSVIPGAPPAPTAPVPASPAPSGSPTSSAPSGSPTSSAPSGSPASSAPSGSPASSAPGSSAPAATTAPSAAG